MNILKITNSKQEHRRCVFPIFIFLLFIGSINLNAQNQKLTLSLEKVSLRQLFNAIEKQSEYKFLYRDIILDDKNDLSIKVDGKEVTYIFGSVLKLFKKVNYVQLCLMSTLEECKNFISLSVCNYANPISIK